MGATPLAPKRARRTSPTLNRRVRANINMLSIPDIHSDGPSAPLQLAPQGRADVGGLSFDKILLKSKVAPAPASPAKKSHVIVPLPKSNSRNSPKNIIRAPALRGSPLKGPNNSLMALRMASMVKGSVDAKAQLKFGGLNKSFQVPGRARSSPYRPSRALPTRNLNRSFNALCVS